MIIIRSIIGLVLILAVCYFVSMNRSGVSKRYKNIAIMFILQLIIAFVSLRTDVGISILGSISKFFGWLIEQAQGGVNFVFGGIAIESNVSVFFFNVLLPIVFISALIGILDYIKVLPFLMKWVGLAINKITGVGELESQYAITTTLIGQPAAYVTITEQIKRMSGKRLFTFLLTSCSTVAASGFAAYMAMIPGEYVVVSVLLNIFSAFIIASIINPYDVKEEDKLIEIPETVVTDEEGKTNIIDVVSKYILEGWNLALIVAAMLIGFISIITFLNSTFVNIVGIEFTQVIGYLFSPIAYLTGVPSSDVVEVGGIMATKLLTNEYVALGEVGNLLGKIEPKSFAIISVFCMSFANIGTLGIVTGGIKAIDDQKAKVVTGFAGKLLLGATLSSLFTATLVGLFF